MTDTGQLYDQGRSLLLARKPAEARPVLEQLVKHSPKHHDAIHLLAIACFELGQRDRSLSLMKQSLDLATDRADFWSDYVVALAHLPERAGEMLQTAQQALTRFPQLQGVWNTVANYFELQRDFSQLQTVLEQANQALGGNPSFQLRLARCYRQIGAHQRAVETLTGLLTNQPGNVDARCLLGGILYQLGRIEAACEHWDRVLATNPQEISVLSALMVGRRQCCDWRGYDDFPQRVRQATEQKLQAGKMPLESPVVCVSNFMDSAYNLRIAQAWAVQTAKAGSGMRRFNSNGSRTGQSRRITVGYLSDEFRDHPTGLLMLSYFQLHNRDRFRIVTYFDHRPDEHDCVFQKIRLDSEESYFTGEMSDAVLVEKICEDRVDILVGLKGWREPNRMAVFAERPAPVNVTFLGFPGTTGADYFDYVIADECVIPVDDACYFAEKPAYLGRCYQINDGDQPSFSDLCQAAGKRQDHALPDDAIVLASFNQAYKLDPHTLAVWMDIMKSAENTVLWLLTLNESCQRNLRDFVANRGVKPERLIFAAWADHHQHLARLTHADLGLDTLLYNGHTTTSEALWCRVPVVTVEGKHFASRVSASILRALEMEELITQDLQQYRDVALAIINDASQRNRLRARLTTDRLRASLFNTADFVRSIEDLFEQMHMLTAAGNEPRMLRCRLVDSPIGN